MTVLLLVLLVVLLFGGGGFYAQRGGYFGAGYGGVSVVGLLGVILIVWLLFGGVV